MKKLVVVAAVMVLLAVPAMASYTISHPHSQGLDTNGYSMKINNVTKQSYLGRFVMESADLLPAGYPLQSYTGSDTHQNTFFSYCLNPEKDIAVGHGAIYEYEIGALAGTDGVIAAEAALITELFGRYCPVLNGDPTGNYTGGTFRTAAAALQLAIWEINLDATWNLSSGNMQVLQTIQESGASKTVNQVAMEMLNSLDGTGPMALGLEGLRNPIPDAQELIIQVPEPATMAILGLGGLALLRKRS